MAFGLYIPKWYILAKAKEENQNGGISVWSSPGMILIQRWARPRTTESAIMPAEMAFDQEPEFGSLG